MRFIVLGAGSIGRRHLKNLLGMGHEVVAVFDPDPQKLGTVRRLASCGVVTDDEAQAFGCEADAAIVCSPNSFHIPQAREALRRDLHVFIEKPLSHSLEGTDALAADAAKVKRIVLIGCNLRFCPSLLLVKRLLDEGRIGKPLAARAHCGYYLPYWRPDIDYRNGYGARQAAGGGILLDSIHEFDYLRWLLGEVVEVFCYAGKASTLEIDTEDNADVLLRLASGVGVNLHLDYLQRTYRRSCEFIGEEGLIAWDYIAEKVTLYEKEDRLCKVFQRNINSELNAMYVEEMNHFVRCIEGAEKPILDAVEARAVLKIVIAAKASASEGRAVKIKI